MNKRSIEAVSWGCDRLDAFAVGTDTSLYHKWWTGPADDRTWDNLGGICKSPPAAVSSKRGSLDVFVRGTDRTVFVRHFNGSSSSWSAYQGLGGVGTGNLAAVSWGPDLVGVLGLNEYYGGTWRMRNGTTWAPAWEALGGTFKSELAALSWGPGRIDLFGIGSDESIFTKAYTAGRWAPSYTSLGGTFVSPPTVVSRGPGRLDVFAVDKTTGGLLQKTYADGAWSDWMALGGGPLLSAVTAHTSSSFGAERIDVFALGGNDTVVGKTYDGLTDNWGNWVSHGAAFDSKPVVAGWGADRLDVLCLGKGNVDLWHQAWNGSSWDPSVESWSSEAGSLKKWA